VGVGDPSHGAMDSTKKRETRSGGVEAKLLFCLLFFWFEDGT
jgi:hypothetical protein